MSALPSPLTPVRISVFALVAAFLAIVGATVSHGGADAWRWLHWVCKPLATLLMGMLAWRTSRPVSIAYRRDILIGIALCLSGDILLMLPVDLFVPGLVSFLLAHGLFIAAFCSDVRFAARWWAWLICLVYGALMTALLWHGIEAALRVPVVVYVLVLATMGGQALGRACWLREHGADRANAARHAAAGAVLFMISDSLLAWDRFRAPLPLASVYILTMYYAALWLIARSVDRGAASPTGGQG